EAVEPATPRHPRRRAARRLGARHRVERRPQHGDLPLGRPPPLGRGGRTALRPRLGTRRLMDFALSDELLALGADAREVGLKATADLAVREDSWLIGTSREFSLELAERGWLG